MSKKKSNAPNDALNENSQRTEEMAEAVTEEILQSTDKNGNEAEIQLSIEAFREEKAQMEAQIEELKDKYMRLYAEFENYKKRAIREKIDWMKTASQDTLTALLPVLDDFDRAKKFASENAESGFSEGVDLVYQKLYMTLTGKGLNPMESTGEIFDPEFHDAISEIPAPSEDLKGKVIETIEKGYRLNDKIIRHAKVIVGK